MSRRNKQEPWRNADTRYHCAVCNAWMGSDRQSILLHEGGKKHQENLARNLEDRRADKLQQERDERLLQTSLAAMNQAAGAAHTTDAAYFPRRPDVCAVAPVPAVQTTAPVPAVQTTAPVPRKSQHESGAQQDLASWQDRKQRRHTEQHTASDKEDVEEDATALDDAPHRRRLGPNEGQYTLGTQTYLEGSTFAPIFSQDMPIQIWTGTASAGDADKRKRENQVYWKTGLICKIQTQPPAPSHTTRSRSDGTTVTCDVAYLSHPTDEDEIYATSVASSRLRVVVGDDDGVPSTVEEARLDLLGGEEIVVVDEATTPVQVHEHTGLSGWNTVSVRTVTVRREIQEERARSRATHRTAARREEDAARQRRERTLEEARYADRDDSALGAYDVWNVSGKHGYKGVDLGVVDGSGVDAATAPVRAAAGKVSVAFKKNKRRTGHGGSKVHKKKFKRVTLADDDDD